MAKRILVTGGSGFVAGAIVHEAPADVELYVQTRGAPLCERAGVTWHVFDAVDREQLRAEFEAIAPEAVIHTAAIADIDYCEAHQDEAKAVNVEITRELADLCGAAGAKLVYLSTDTVYDGEKGNYAEEDPPSPLNWYAETKAEAEGIVAAMPGDWVVARVSLVMGLPMLGAGNSFLSRMMPILAAGKELGVPDNEVRSPIDVITLARALLELAQDTYTGYIQLAGNDVLNRCEMVRRIASRLGYDPGLVVPRNPENIPGRAPRPLNASLCNQRARSVLQTPMKGLLDGLELVLAAKDWSSGQ